jgi:hypothetical protein
VIGAGFGRTGTLSLKLALEELGFGPCYHMVETREHPEHDTMWLALAKGEISDWHPMLKDYASTVDWPTTYFWRTLAAQTRRGDHFVARPARLVRERRGDDLRPHARVRKPPDAAAVDPAHAGTWLDKTQAIRVFNAHNEEVRRSVPRERLLVYESGEGWEKLCAFLDVPVPATPYPKVNTTGDFVSRFPGKQ